MKTKLIYLLLFIPILAFSDLNIDKVDKALSSLQSKKNLKFYNKDTSLLNKFRATDSTLEFTSMKKADILLFPKLKTGNKLMIVSSYKALKINKKSIIGAIYIKKGRTQIFFVKERLVEKGLTLPDSMKQYLIHECYLNSLCLLK